MIRQAFRLRTKKTRQVKGKVKSMLIEGIVHKGTIAPCSVKRKNLLIEHGAIKNIANLHGPQQTYKTWLLEKNNKTLKIVYIPHSE
jgi:hypothetical protein